MRFRSKKAYERFVECRQFAAEHNLSDNFNSVITGLLAWERYDDGGNRLNEIEIGTDFDDKCFTFWENYPDGRIGICGGIIFHGTPGNYVENGSVQLRPSYGWQIHT
ncbi:MAG: DUF4120 family protein [Lachnospiraceae bacterium]|nr:DUF4120 family protein [Kiritimatiellia bacterium]MBP5461427.1 DUF4120 family protein [Lachnospiraceae bacterium]